MGKEKEGQMLHQMISRAKLFRPRLRTGPRSLRKRPPMNMLIEKKLKQAVHYHQPETSVKPRIYTGRFWFSTRKTRCLPPLGPGGLRVCNSGILHGEPAIPSSSSAEAGRDIEVDVDDGV